MSLRPRLLPWESRAARMESGKQRYGGVGGRGLGRKGDGQNTIDFLPPRTAAKLYPDSCRTTWLKRSAELAPTIDPQTLNKARRELSSGIIGRSANPFGAGCFNPTHLRFRRGFGGATP